MGMSGFRSWRVVGKDLRDSLLGGKRIWAKIFKITGRGYKVHFDPWRRWP